MRFRKVFSRRPNSGILPSSLNVFVPSGKLFLIIGPSGVGKGTIIRLFKEKYPDKFVFPVSATTRPPRPGEKEGQAYHFLSAEDFQEKIRNGEFLEWAQVHGQHYYGTLRKPTLEALQEGKNVMRELDIQGFESLFAGDFPPHQLVSIFLLPPSIEILKKRIRKRSPLSPEELEKRIQSMATEMARGEKCDHQVQTIEGDIPGTFAQVEAVVKEELGEI